MKRNWIENDHPWNVWDLVVVEVNVELSKDHVVYEEDVLWELTATIVHSHLVTLAKKVMQY